MEKNKTYNNRLEFIEDLNSYISPDGKGVEVGVYKGEFSQEILKNWTGTLFMVDVWRPLGEEYNDSSNHKYHSDILAETMNNIQGYEDRGIIIRANSEIASQMFQDESLDFVYIDANHAYDFVKKDIQLWFPKVKKGGLFCGHDYMNLDWYNDPNFLPNGKDKHIYTNTYEGKIHYNGVFGVNPAIDEFFNENNLKLNVIKEWFGTWWTIK